MIYTNGLVRLKMTDPKILLASLAAAYLYVVTPGPAFLALFTLAASRGRASGAWFICGHLVGDVTWGALAVAAIVGANRIGPTLFELLGFFCGLYLLYLGARAVMTRKNAPPRTIGAQASARDRHGLRAHQPQILSGGARDVLGHRRPLYGRAETGRRAADVRRGLRGLPARGHDPDLRRGLAPVRRFFLTHGVAVTRLVGVIFILFGAKSIADAAGGRDAPHGVRAPAPGLNDLPEHAAVDAERRAGRAGRLFRAEIDDHVRDLIGRREAARAATSAASSSGSSARPALA